MSNTKTTVVSGCVIWFVLLSVIGSCVMPIFFLIGGISSASDFAIQTTGRYICAEGTTPQSFSYDTFTTDEYGISRPSTAYELHCVDASGDVVQKDPIGYAFLWIGVAALLGAVVTGVLAFVFAVPGGVLVTKMLSKLKVRKTNPQSQF